MYKYIAIILLTVSILPFGTAAFADTIELEKKDYLTLIVGNYVHGFKEFDTSVTAFEDSVSIGIYYDDSKQGKERANQLANRFREQIPILIKRYLWAENVKIIINVYSEDRDKGY